MFNTYTSSLQWPIRSRNHQDYCSLLPERSESYRFLQSSSSRRCCCVSSRSSRCCCCATPCSSSSYVKPKVSINPGFVIYGIRQSTLIQWPSFQRRLLVCGNRLVGCEVYASCDGRRRKNRSFRLRGLEESNECCEDDDVEAMISFLSEELIDEERKWNLVSRVEESKKVGNVKKVRDSYGDGRVTRKNKQERLERPEGFGRRNEIKEDVKLDGRDDCEHCGSRKKSSQLESESRRGSNKLVSGESIGKSKRRNEEREVRPVRTKSSSCSSYYSLASSAEFESDTEDQEEDEAIHRENVRSSGKKVVELKSRKESSQMHSRRKKDESSDRVGSSYQAVILNQRRGKKFSQTSNRASESTGNYEEDTEIHEIHVNDAETNSQTQKLFGEREDYRVHSILNDSGSENIESSQQLLKERSEARYSSEERVSEMRRRTKYRESQEEDINVLQNFPEARNNQQPLVEGRLSKQTDMRRTTERFSESSKIHDIHIRNTYVSQSEEQIRNQEVHAGLVSGLQSERKQQDDHNEHNPLQRTQSDRTSVSVSHTSDTVRYTEIKRKSEKRLIGQESTTNLQSDSNAEKSGAWKDSRRDHANSTKEDEMALWDLSSQEKLAEDASSSQSSLTLVGRNKMHLVDLVSAEMQGSQTTLIPPSSQLVSRGSGNSYGTGGVSIQEISHETSESGDPTVFDYPIAGALATSQSAGEPMRVTTHEGALGSAHRLEQSSEKFVGEFLKKAKHEVSYPETGEQRVESNQLKRRDSRRSSGSGAKGPSDELWVTDSTQGTPQPGATEGNAAEGNATFKRNGRSLWNVIADIARLRWGSRAGNSDSSAKPAGKNSPNESVSSATWFSGREHEGSSDDNKGDRVLPQEAHSLHQLVVGQTSPRGQFESSGTTKLKQQSGRHEDVVLPPSSTILEGGTASNHMASTSGDQIVRVDEEEGRNFEFRLSETASTGVPKKLPSRNLIRSPAIKEPSESSPTKVTSDQNVTVGEGRRYQARIPEMDASQKPLPFAGRNLRSPVVKEPSESRPSMVSGSSSLSEQVEQQQPLSAKSQEETGSIPADSSFTQKKLQRNKQVMRDSFEEWEEAYRVEAERRTIDEIFMREALVEAKKAADTWEVPVGAVLVHDGKIIARGSNLVEELRDSTAHAEMICIREGSKVLRSWRLADTTLYVTLEPCPMCAGAILQARVNTLVWGAPNKLLGADGSWIRLFPGGEENGSENSEKPPPPVHPFHPKMTIRRGVLESECAQTMQQFFQLRRKKKDKNPDPPAPTEHHHHLHPSKLLNKMHQVLPFFCL
ncbi:PREDICTED: tRNA(adenine(34)) deaminase, chloroplastic-like [Camelina sativa]|uniref:tRNA(adenine(34)) deaminase n=1 Tax=Camelina sativa TaxID=90675 RepID=A0ABM0Z8F1_CAMSA|nr:PREDICTED: tRNA(adenine(34)) deaminase, chloroplastic-like [Camelina sativa]